MEYSESHRKMLQLKHMATYGLGIITLLGVIHCVLLVCGYDIFWLHIIALAFIYIIGIGISRLFGLCLIHRLCVTYFLGIMVCIEMKRERIIPADAYGTQVARVIVAAIGIILMCLLTWKVRNRKSCSKNC